METFAYQPPTAGKTIGGFLASINADTNPLIDWQSFLQAWKNYSGDTTNDLEAEFIDDFKKQVGFVDANGDPVTDPAGTDWEALTNVIGEDQQPLGITDDIIKTFWKASFSHFLGSYPYEEVASDIDENPDTPDVMVPKSIGDATTAPDNFFTAWTTYMARSAEIDDSTSGLGDTSANGVDLAAYEQIYVSFFPQETGETPAQVQARYVSRLSKFYEKSLKENGAGSVENGWFIPSHHFDEWFEDLREDFIKDVTVTSVEIRTTVTSDAAHRILVIDRILRLLVEMVDVLQRISAAQAQRLSFLTNWQQAYTELVTDVPQFAQGDGSPLEGGGKGPKAFRNNDVNPHMQAILEKVRARRSNVQDEAKQMQTTINQTQDAANQQTQMATSLLQQLSTILGQIFR
jgi:hypothetical protein